MFGFHFPVCHSIPFKETTNDPSRRGQVGQDFWETFPARYRPAALIKQVLSAYGNYMPSSDTQQSTQKICSESDHKRPHFSFRPLPLVSTLMQIPKVSTRKTAGVLEAQRSSLIIATTPGKCRAIAGAVRKAMEKKGLLSVRGTFRYGLRLRPPF